MEYQSLAYRSHAWFITSWIHEF